MGRYRFRPRTPLADRFWPKVARRGANECWPWLGAKHPGGYGRLSLGGRGSRMAPATHVAWTIATGTEVPDGMSICHRCDNPPCVNPGHLFLGTKGDNARDMISKGRGRQPRLSGAAHPLVLDSSRAARGEAHGRSILTAAKVAEIRERYARGETITSLSLRFVAVRTTIRLIVTRKTWKHVP